MDDGSTQPPEPRHAQPLKVPRGSNVFNGVVSRLSRVGVALGPNSLLTVPGRKSGRARTTPIAILEIGERRFVQSPYGEVQWTRNLRAAGQATLATGRRAERVPQPGSHRPRLQPSTGRYCRPTSASPSSHAFSWAAAWAWAPDRGSPAAAATHPFSSSTTSTDHFALCRTCARAGRPAITPCFVG